MNMAGGRGKSNFRVAGTPNLNLKPGPKGELEFLERDRNIL